MVNQKPADYQEKKTRLELENQLAELLAGATKLADSSCTRDNTRDRLIDECKNVKQALQNLMDEYMKHVIFMHQAIVFIFSNFLFRKCLGPRYNMIVNLEKTVDKITKVT